MRLPLIVSSRSSSAVMIVPMGKLKGQSWGPRVGVSTCPMLSALIGDGFKAC